MDKTKLASLLSCAALAAGCTPTNLPEEPDTTFSVQLGNKIVDEISIKKNGTVALRIYDKTTGLPKGAPIEMDCQDYADTAPILLDVARYLKASGCSSALQQSMKKKG